MKLITDYATPYELSVVARESAVERERVENKLAAVLPTETVDATTVTLIEGDNGRVEIAEYRAYDAETAFGHAGGPGRRQVVELAPLGQQARVSEYDQLQMRNLGNVPERVRNSIGKTAVNLGRAVADRLELARGEVLQTGKLTINEGGFIAEIDFGRDADMAVTAATPWGTTGAGIIDEINSWVDAYVEANGQMPAAILAGRQVVTAIKKSEDMIAAASNGAVAQRVTTEFVQQFLEAEGLPQILQYDRKVLQGGAAVDVIDPKVMLFLPAAELGSGSTAMGTTLESQHPDYNMVPGEEPGIVVGAYQSHNPMGLYLNSAAIGLPVLHDPNAFMAATVL